jgi:hypothetical protein
MVQTPGHCVGNPNLKRRKRKKERKKEEEEKIVKQQLIVIIIIIIIITSTTTATKELSFLCRLLSFFLLSSSFETSSCLSDVDGPRRVSVTPTVVAVLDSMGQKVVGWPIRYLRRFETLDMHTLTGAHTNK